MHESNKAPTKKRSYPRALTGALRATPPEGSLTNIVGLALLGYLYLGATVIVILLSIALIVALACLTHVFFLLKFSLILLPTIGLMIKSVWVKIDPPEGKVLSRTDAPKLFELVSDLRKRTGAPAINSIVLNDEFNCGIIQIPRFGFSGWYKNYVVLGLPLMDSLSLNEFKAVLAHEMGHLSSEHGKLGAWVYRVRMSWLRLYISLVQQQTAGHQQIRKFAEWFVPKFDAETLALMRKHELAADQISASVAGKQIAAQALIKTDAIGSMLSRKFWNDQLKLANALPEPVPDVYTRLSEAVCQPMPETKVREYLRLSWKETGEMDTHPPLRERIHALGVSDDFADVDALPLDFLLQSSGRPASSALLGGTLTSIRDELNRGWSKKMAPLWALRHKWLQEQKEKLDALQPKYEAGELVPSEARRIAQLTSLLNDTDGAIAVHRDLLQDFPDEAKIHFSLAELLFEGDHPDVIAECEKAMQLRPALTQECCSLIAMELNRSGRSDDAEGYTRKAKDCEEEMAQAAQEYLQGFKAEDEFKAYDLDTAERGWLCAAIHAHPEVSEAYIVAKVVPAIIGSAIPILVLRMSGAGSTAFEQLANEVAPSADLDGVWVMSYGAMGSGLSKAVNAISGAKFYARDGYVPCEGTTPASGAAPLLDNTIVSAKPVRPAASRRQKMLYAALVLVIFLSVASLVLSSRAPSLQSSKQAEVNMPDERSVVPQDTQTFMQMLQRRVKKHWFPPRMSRSAHVVVAFTVLKDGRLVNPSIAKSSDIEDMDAAAIRAIKSTRMPPLPPDIKEDRADVQFTLDYNVWDHGQKVTH